MNLNTVLLLLFIGSVTSPASAAEQTDVIWDLTTQYNQPGEQRIPIFRDTHFADGTACEFNFQLNGAPFAHLSKLQSQGDLIKRFRAASWSIVNWHWMNDARQISKQNLPNLCSEESKELSSEGSASLFVDYDGQRVETLTVARTFWLLQMNSEGYFKKLFGALYYPASNKVSWPLLMLNGTYRFRYLSDYSMMNLTLQAKLQSFRAEQDVIKTAETAPSGAAFAYNPGVNGTRFYLSIPLRWHAKYCSAEIVHSDPICVKYFNHPLNLMIYIFDDRWEYWTKPPITSDPGTANPGHVYLYRISIRDIIPGKPEKNPFKVVGKTSEAHADLLPIIVKTILSVRQRGDEDGTDYVPPRLLIGGQPESDDQYIADFGISTVGLGYENSGLADLSFEIDAFSLVGIRR